MIIDFNAHIGRFYDRNIDFTMDNLKESIKSSEIDVAVVSDISTAFEKTPDELSDYNSKNIVRFFSLSPDHNINNIDSSVSGIRIYPTYQEWDFTSSKWQDLLKRARLEKWIVQIYLKLRDQRLLQQITESDTVLNSLSLTMDNYSDINFVISGAVLYEASEHQDFFSRENVWTETAHLQHPIDSLQKLIDVIDVKRILFGSNAPFFYSGSNVFRVENSLISNEYKELIFEQNARRLLQNAMR